MKTLYFILLSVLTSVTSFAQVDSKCMTPVTGNGQVSIGAGGSGTFSGIYTDIPINTGLFDASLFGTGNISLSPKTDFEISSFKVYIKADFGDNYPWGTEQYQVDITDLKLNLWIGKQGGGYTNAVTNISPPNTFILTDENPEYILELDLTNELLGTNSSDFSLKQTLYNNNNNLAVVSIEPSITVSNLGAGLVTGDEQQVANNLRFSICHEVEYKVAPTSDYPIAVNAPYQIGNTKRYVFSWSNAKSSTDELLSPYYELQIARLYNSKDHEPTSQEDIQTAIDWTKAMSFILPENTLAKTTVNNLATYAKELTLSEFTGYYAWRVRPIGTFSDGGVANNNNWGDWNSAASTVLTQGTLIDLNQQSDLGTIAYAGSVFFFRDPDESKERNTIYSRVFTEGGKTHEGMNYADGLLKSRQSQSYFPSNGNRRTVITQQFYDHVGRNAISTLPVPTENKLSGYQERFAQDALTQELYTVDKFDNVQNPQSESPSPMTLKGANPTETDYYSNNGPDPYVDNAQGFPFSISRYSNDGLDNVNQQSGVGKRHMIGDVAMGMGKTTHKNYTSDVSADELIRIFGAEAPDNTTVTKEVTTDPNGTESVSYIDKTGKLLATCLSFNADLNGALQDLSGANTGFQVKDLMMASQLVNGGFVSSKRILFTEDGNTLNIDYTPEGCNGFDICGETLYCDFEVTLFVADIDHPTVNLIPVADRTKLISELCNQNITVYSIGLSLDEGDYLVRKTLKAVDNAANGSSTIQAFIDAKVRRTEKTMYTYNELITNILGNITDDNASDFVTAMNCVNSFVANASPLGVVAAPNTVLQGYITTLETCLTDPSGLNFDMSNFNFSEFEHTDIDFEVVSNISINANGEIAIEFEDCGLGIEDLTIDATINILVPPCEATAGGQYTYKSQLYNLPPFLEYFVDDVLVGLRDRVIEQWITANNGTQPTNTDIRTALDNAIDANYAAYSDLQTLLEALFPGYGITGTSVHAYLEGNGSINVNDFNKMIWHMLNDQYYCGQLVWQEGDATTQAGYYSVDATGTIAATPFDFSPQTNPGEVRAQYDCKDLWNCWQGNVKSIAAILSLELEGVSDVFSAIDDNKPSGGEDFNQHFQDNIPWLLRLFLGEVDPLGGFKNDPAFQGGIPVSDQRFDNLPDLFLKCTGYRIARIIDPRIVTDNSGNIILGDAGVNHSAIYATHLNGSSHPHQLGSAALGALPTIEFNTLDMPLKGVDLTTVTTVPQAIEDDMAYPNTSSPSSKNEINEYFNTRNATPIDADRFPFTYNPVFAFKYYEYHHPQTGPSKTEQAFLDYNNDPANTSDPDFSPVVLPWFLASIDPPIHYQSIEIEMNYPYGGVDATTNNPFCVTTVLTEVSGHDQWTCGYRYDFLQAIINRQELVINPANFDDPQAVFSTANPQFPQGCDDAVDDYSDASGQATPLDNPMANSCKNACESRRSEFREAVVLALEKRCYVVGGCPDCPNHVSTENVETMVSSLVAACKDQCAVNVQTSATNPCPNVISCDITYGTPCQQYLMEQVRSWKPEVDFESKCDPSTPFPVGHLKNDYDANNTGNSCDNTTTDFSTQPATGPKSPVKIIQQP